MINDLDEIIGNEENFTVREIDIEGSKTPLWPQRFACG